MKQRKPQRGRFGAGLAVGWALAALGVLSVFAGEAIAQPKLGDAEYRFKKGDVLRIVIPSRPSLNRDLAVDETGAIAIPLIGGIGVEGLTAVEAHEKIYQALRDYYPSIERLDLTVEGVPTVIVYITGEVATPGKYTFTAPPNLWDAIREAGGPTGTAALDLVRIVRSDAIGGAPETFNVLAAMENGTTDTLPTLRDGDTVVLSSARETYVGSLGVNVVGAVVKPGFYRLQGEHHDVMSAIMMAGGMLPKAAVGAVKIIRKHADGTTLTEKLDLDKYVEKGDPRFNPLLNPGDTVVVPEQNAWAYQFKTNFGVILSLIATTATVLLVIDRIREN
jgi:polysaccharide export outer membrane protein